MNHKGIVFNILKFQIFSRGVLSNLRYLAFRRVSVPGALDFVTGRGVGAVEAAADVEVLAFAFRPLEVGECQRRSRAVLGLRGGLAAGQVPTVHLFHQLQLPCLGGAVEVGVAEVGDHLSGVERLVVDVGALVLGRQEPRAEAIQSFSSDFDLRRILGAISLDSGVCRRVSLILAWASIETA